jgi:hypothetical protein
MRGMTQLAELAATDELSAFAKAHRVSAEITAHYGSSGGRRVQTGLDVALLARPSPSCVADPGCEDCRRETGWQPEIEVVVEMQPLAPVPLAEVLAKRGLEAIRQNLRELGVAHDRSR